MESYLNTLDVYVVSHGGVSSNYINDLLARHGYRTGKHDELWNTLAHAIRPHSNNVKTLYIHGDYEQAIASQNYRNILGMNMNKIRNGTCKGNTMDEFISMYPDDPMGIKAQYYNFVGQPNVWTLKYPYTKEQLIRLFQSMKLKINPNTIKIKPRDTHIIPERIKTLCQVYENWTP